MSIVLCGLTTPLSGACSRPLPTCIEPVDHPLPHRDKFGMEWTPVGSGGVLSCAPALRENPQVSSRCGERQMSESSTTDLDRYIAFLEGAKMPHEVDKKSDVKLIRMKPDDGVIRYAPHATRVATAITETYFDQTGRFAGMATRKLEPQLDCGDWDPETHEPSGLTTCRNCGYGPEESHRRPLPS